MQVSVLQQQYLLHHGALGHSPKTISHYEDTFRLLDRFIEASGKAPTTAIMTTSVMDEFAVWLRDTSTRGWRGQTTRTEAGVPLPASNWTFEDFVEAATALTIDEDGDGVNEVHGLATESSIIRHAPFIWSAGGIVVDDVDHPTELTLDTPEAREAIEWFVNLGEQGHDVVPSEAEVLAEDHLSRFMNGRAAMFMQSRRVVPTLREIDGFRWDVAPLPRAEEPAGILHSDALCMSATAEDKDSAWAFIEYAVSPEGQRVLAETGRTVPSLKSVAESPVFLGDDALPPSSEVYLDTIPYLRRVPSIATWPEIEDIYNAEFQKALYGEFDLDEALRTVDAKVEDVLQREEKE